MVAGMLILAGVILIFLPNTSVVQGLWPSFLGWYLFSAASASRRQLELKGHLTGLKARDAMARSCPVVPHSLTLDVLVDGYIVPTGCRVFLVASFSEPKGIVTTHQVRMVGRDRWRDTRIESIMMALDKMPMVKPDEDAYHVLEIMSEADATEVPVVEDGNIIGLVGREDILRIASIRSELSR
jgi:predicted transcriptional regulator